MNRSFISALISLACLSTLPALAQATGSAPATVTFSVSGKPTVAGTFTGTVQPALPLSPTPFPRPGGTVTFFDGSTALNPGGTALTAAGYLSAPFSDAFGMGADPLATWQGVAGDFNGDGVPDLLICSTDSVSNTLLLQVFIGVTAQFVALPKQSFPFPPQIHPSSATVLDVDGDGKLDLLVGNTVAYGNGDGTFSRIAMLPILATGFSQTYAVDVDGDGKPDIVAVNTPPKAIDTTSTVQFTFTVFRNDGGGTFTSLGSFPLAPSFQTGVNMCCALYNIFGLSFADVNGDGKVDALSQSNSFPDVNASAANQFNVMLNNEDGTFGAPKSIDTSALRALQGTAVAFGDLNGDRKNDLVVAYANPEGSNYVAAALGNGDGTFGAFSPLVLIAGVTPAIEDPQVQLADFNVDGKLDAILGSGELALGNGDGTFTLSTPLFPQAANPQTPLNYPLLQIPIYTNTLPSLVYLNFTNTKAVFTPMVSSSGSFTPVLGGGSHVITVHYSGDSTYAPGVSSPATVTVAGVATTSLTLTAITNTTFVGGTSVITASVAGLAPGAGGTITFTQGSTVTPVAMQNGSANYTATFATLGNNLITATYSGDAGDAPSSGSISISVVAAPISFPTPPTFSTTLTGTSGSAAFGSVGIDAVAGYFGALSLTCIGLPANASCSFTPQIPVISAPSGGSASYGIIVALYSPAPIMGKVDDPATARGAVEWCGVSLLSLLLMGRIRRSRLGRLCLVLAAGAFMSLTGCGGGNSSKSRTKVSATPPGTYTFQLKAATSLTTDGPYSSPVSQTYTLIVQ